jgi:lysozyme
VTIGRVVDVSSNDHDDLPPGVGPAIDWVTAKNNGVTTALVKATQGTTYVNPWFHIDANGAKAAGLDVLGYHFADFTDAVAEARWFMSNAGPLAAIGDFETSTNVAWMRTFLQALGRPWDQCVGYGSASSFRSVYQQIPALPWVAAYGQGYPGWGVMWQFTDAAQIPGIPGTVDESRWQGSEIQYDTLFGVYAPPVPEPPSAEDYIVTDSVALDNGTIVSHAVGRDGSPIAGHYLEITRSAGKQGQPANDGLSIIDITAEYPQFPVAP